MVLFRFLEEDLVVLYCDFLIAVVYDLNVAQHLDSAFPDEVQVLGLVVLAHHQRVGLQVGYVGLRGDDEQRVVVQAIHEVQ